MVQVSLNQMNECMLFKHFYRNHKYLLWAGLSVVLRRQVAHEVAVGPGVGGGLPPGGPRLLPVPSLRLLGHDVPVSLQVRVSRCSVGQ